MKRSGHDWQRGCCVESGQEMKKHTARFHTRDCADWSRRIACAWPEVSVELPTEGSGGILEG